MGDGSGIVLFNRRGRGDGGPAASRRQLLASALGAVAYPLRQLLASAIGAVAYPLRQLLASTMATEVGSLSGICSWWSLRFACDDSSDSARAIILAATIALAFAAASAAATKDAVVRAAAGSLSGICVCFKTHLGGTWGDRECISGLAFEFPKGLKRR